MLILKSDHITTQQLSKESGLSASNLHYGEGMTDYSNYIIAQQLSQEYGLPASNLHYDSNYIIAQQLIKEHGLPASDQDEVIFLLADGYEVSSKNSLWAVLERQEKNETLLDGLLDKVSLLIPLDISTESESESLLVYDNGKLKRIFPQRQSWAHIKKNENTEITTTDAKITALETRLQSVSEKVYENSGKLSIYGILLPTLLAAIIASKIWSVQRERALEKRIEKLSQQVEELSQQVEKLSPKTKRSPKKSKH